jgi:hypothetical protein
MVAQLTYFHFVILEIFNLQLDFQIYCLIHSKSPC